MDDVEVGNIVEEETTLPAEDGPVNSGSSTALEVPLLSAVVGQRGVGVVEVGDHDNC